MEHLGDVFGFTDQYELFAGQLLGRVEVGDSAYKCYLEYLAKDPDELHLDHRFWMSLRDAVILQQQIRRKPSAWISELQNLPTRDYYLEQQKLCKEQLRTRLTDAHFQFNLKAQREKLWRQEIYMVKLEADYKNWRDFHFDLAYLLSLRLKYIAVDVKIDAEQERIAALMEKNLDRHKKCCTEKGYEPPPAQWFDL